MYIDSGNFRDAKIILYQECSFIADVIPKMLLEKPPLNYQWLLRQSCADQICDGCELFCASFPLYDSLANNITSLSQGCIIEGFNTICSIGRDPQQHLPDTLPDYSLLFSIKGKTGLKIKRLKHDMTYDTICQKRAYQNLLKDVCIDLTNAFFVPKYGKIYLPEHDSKLDVFKVIAINFTLLSHQYHKSLERIDVTQDKGAECLQKIKNPAIQEQLSKIFLKQNETEMHACVMLNYTYDSIIDAFRVNKNNFYGSGSLLLFNFDILFNQDYCDVGDDLLLVNVSIVNISGEIMISAVVDDDRLLSALNKSIVIGVIENPENEMALNTLMCKRKKGYISYLGIITVICNSISMTFLFIVVMLFLMVKSIRSKMVISIPQLATALFFAQLLFQVCEYSVYVSR